MTIMNSFKGRKGAIKLLLVYWIITLVIVTVLEIDEEGTANKVIFSVFCWIPLVLSSFVLFYNYALLIFDDDKENDKEITILNLILVSTIWVVSWSNLFLLLWAWDRQSWLLLQDPGAFEAWIKLFSTTLLIAPGVGFAAHVPVNVWAHIISATMAWTAFLVVVLIISTGISTVIETIPKSPEKDNKNPSNNNNNINNRTSNTNTINTRYFTIN